MESTRTKEIVKNILGEVMYQKLFKKIITDITSKTRNEASPEEINDVIDIYCFILLLLSNSESVEPVGTYTIHLGTESFKVQTEEITEEYKEYINLIKDNN